MSYTGILELLKGLMLCPDEPEANGFLASAIPVVVVQSTEDVFVDPRQAAAYFTQDNMLRFGRRVVEDFGQINEPSTVHINWIKSGHEIIQERTPFLLGVLSGLAKCWGIHPEGPSTASQPPSPLSANSLHIGGDSDDNSVNSVEEEHVSPSVSAAVGVRVGSDISRSTCRSRLLWTTT